VGSFYSEGPRAFCAPLTVKAGMTLVPLLHADRLATRANSPLVATARLEREPRARRSPSARSTGTTVAPLATVVPVEGGVPRSKTRTLPASSAGAGSTVVTSLRPPRPAEGPFGGASVRWIRRDWARHAICRGMDTELFFGTQSNEVAAAIEICRGCSVRSDCLDRALRDPDVRGVWGGTSESERRRMRRAASGISSPRRAPVRR